MNTQPKGLLAEDIDVKIKFRNSTLCAGDQLKARLTFKPRGSDPIDLVLSYVQLQGNFQGYSGYFTTSKKLLFTNYSLDNTGFTKSYRFILPEDLPPTCMNESLKIEYRLVVGLMKTPTELLENFVGFRVLPSRASDFIYDLNRIIVVDATSAGNIRDSIDSSQLGPKRNSVTSVSTKDDQADKVDFLRYAKALVSGKRKPRQTSNQFSATNSISRSQTIGSSSSTLYRIMRSGSFLCSLKLSKPIYKLGESIIFILESQITLHVTAILEAVVTKPGIETISRTPVQKMSMSTYSLKRAHFEFVVPVTHTPQFNCIDASYAYGLKFELITSGKLEKSIIEPVHMDDQGSISVLYEALECEYFGFSVPLTIHANDIETRETKILVF